MPRLPFLMLMGTVVSLNLTASADAKSPGFHIDVIKPGEGLESDCYTIYYRSGGTQEEPPVLFEFSGDIGYIKIDNKVHLLNKTNETARVTTFSDREVTVSDTSLVTRKIPDPDGDTYYLKGTLVVTYQGAQQTLSLKGESFCYSGG